MFIRIKALDTLFFRTPRPFTAGVETWTDTIFPPYPRTVYGALRTYLIFERGDLKRFERGEFEKELGTPNSYGNFKIKGPFLMRKDTIFFRTPLDTVIVNDRVKFLKFFKSKPEIMISDYELEGAFIWQKDEKVGEPEGWISIQDMIKYLKGEDDFKYHKRDEFFLPEAKVGIGRNIQTLTVKTGYLYRTNFTRMKENVYLGVEIEGVEPIKEKGLFQLGGERKSAIFEKMNRDPLEELKNLKPDLSNRLFKLYFATPTIFENGWLPSWINKENMEGEYENVKVRLIACVVEKFQIVGGWDLNQKMQKPLQKAVPAGSVYYFEILDGDKDAVIEAFHLKNVSDENYDDERNKKEGFGLALVGEVKNL